VRCREGRLARVPAATDPSLSTGYLPELQKQSARVGMGNRVVIRSNFEWQFPCFRCLGVKQTPGGWRMTPDWRSCCNAVRHPEDGGLTRQDNSFYVRGNCPEGALQFLPDFSVLGIIHIMSQGR
jgi:hypothetical protein